jgi:hypothetical protein
MPLNASQGGPFYGVLLLEPDFDIYATNPDGSPYWAYPGQVPIPGGRPTVAGNNAINPLYSLSTTTFDLRRSRILANAALSYQILSWWRVEAQGSYDRAEEFFKRVTRRDTYNSNMNAYTNGGLTQYEDLDDGLVLTANSYFKQSFGDFNTSLTLRYQFERYTGNFAQVSGSQFVVSEVPQPQALDHNNHLRTLPSETRMYALRISLLMAFLTTKRSISSKLWFAVMHHRSLAQKLARRFSSVSREHGESPKM